MYQQPYYPPPQRTNTMAIVSLVCAFVFSPLGIVFGIMARKEIRRTGEEGWGLATAGLIISSIFTALGVLVLIGYIILIIYVLRHVPTQ